VRTRIALLLISVFACTTSGQDLASSQPAPDLKTLGVASIRVDKHRFKSGEEIEVMIFLEAGPNGVHVPKPWGLSGGGIPGFSVHLTTLSGEEAKTCGSAADAAPVHEPDARVALNRDFIYLPVGQVVGVKTSISCPTKRRGKYLIDAFYSPYHIDAERVAQLPETHGLVLLKEVHAEPVGISIY
jgi:hypothetical protein